jgi:hypothetical protein
MVPAIPEWPQLEYGLFFRVVVTCWLCVVKWLMTFSKEIRDYEAIIVDSIDPLVLSCGCSLDEYGRE